MAVPTSSHGDMAIRGQTATDRAHHPTMAAICGMAQVIQNNNAALMGIKEELRNRLDEVHGAVPDDRPDTPPTSVTISGLIGGQFAETGTHLADQVRIVADIKEQLERV